MIERDPNTRGPESGMRLSAEQGSRDLLTADPDVLLDLDEEAARQQSIARLRLVWDQRRRLMKLFIWGLAISTIMAFILPKKYESTAQLMPPENAGASAAAMLGALAGKGSPLLPLAESALGLKTTGDLFAGILQSQTVQDDVIRRLDLQKLYGSRYIEDARRELSRRTEISQDRKSGIITIVVTDRSPQRAAAMVQEYISQLNWVVNNLTTSSAHRERVFLEQRLGQVNTDLQNAEQQFSKFASEKGTIDIQAQGKAMVEAAATLQGQLIAAQSELGGLRQIYTDNNVRIRSLEARVAGLRSELEKIGGKGVGENSSIQELYPSIRQLPLLGVNYANFLRQVKVQEAVFETLTQQYELAKVQEAKEIPTVKVLDPPMVPQKRSSPHRLLIIILGSLLAVGLGVLHAFAMAAWERMDPQDPRKVFALEVLQTTRAHLPWAADAGSRFRTVSQRVWRRLRPQSHAPSDSQQNTLS